MNKSQSQSINVREQQMRVQPTIYSFTLKDVPSSKYAETLDVLFHNPDYNDLVEKRNRLVRSAERLRRGSSEMNSLVRTVQQQDRKLADIMFASIVQTYLYSDVNKDFMSFSSLLKYYVDYRKVGMKERVYRLAANLDKVTFLADMLESIVTDIKADMLEIFQGNINFQQFDAVLAVLTQLRGFFNSTRSKESDSPDAQLYMNYADSINEYIAKRLKTYTAKYRKLHPALPVYSADDMAEALSSFLTIDKSRCYAFLKYTECGGVYIDAVSLAFNLNEEQTAHIDKLVSKPVTKDMMSYSFDVTDAIMSKFKSSQSR